MADSPASSYASAIAEVDKSNNTLDATIDDLEKVETFFPNSSVQSFFINPTISDEKKLEVIKDIAAAFDLQIYTVNFLSILIDMRRIDFIGEIVKEFEFCFNAITGREVALVSSVVKLESQHLAQIAKTVQRLTASKNVRIKTAIDPSLVAGFTIRMRLPLSWTSQLSRLLEVRSGSLFFDYACPFFLFRLLVSNL
ncbi:hypothetical protein KSP40_PGU007689 [Platanthera guangdongensis]|uniref:ATP synthase subunit delta, chloroplastic n=1 Tax=Platanthera guangdongensis TaxID=2320717 RepID=A0ABR2LKV0_9ASPA